MTVQSSKFKVQNYSLQFKVTKTFSFGLKLLTFNFALLTILAFLPSQVSAPAQGACNSSVRADGLVTTPVLDATSGTPSKFGTNAGACVTQTTQAALRDVQIQSYDALKALYYTQNKFANKTNITSQAGSYSDAVSGDKISYSSTNLILFPGSPFTGQGTKVLFVDGYINIHGDIDYHDTDSGGGLVLIARDGINIQPNVNKIDAFLISGGTICTDDQFQDSQPCPSGFANPIPVTSTPNLVIHGGVVSLNSSAGPRFRRTFNVNTTPAEEVDYDSKYLYLLKNMVSQTLSIVTQGTNYGQ